MFGALIGSYSMAYEIWGDTVVTSDDLARAASAGELFMSERAQAGVGTQAAGEARTTTGITGEPIAGFAVADFYS